MFMCLGVQVTDLEKTPELICPQALTEEQGFFPSNLNFTPEVMLTSYSIMPFTF